MERYILAARILILKIFVLFSLQAFAAPANFVYQGQIIKPDSNPLEAASVDFVVQVLSPAPNFCVLYEETHSGVNMTGSNGLFALPIGTGTSTAMGHYHPSFAPSFDNSAGSITPTNCDVPGSYDANPGDNRVLRVTFDEGGGPIAIADSTIRAVPYAQYASNAVTVGGVALTGLLQVRDDASYDLNQTNLEWVFESATRWPELQALIGGTSSQYISSSPSATVNLNGQVLDNIAAPSDANDAANKNYVDTQIGGQNADALITSPTITQDGYVISWNNTNNEYELVDGSAAFGDDLGNHTATANIQTGANYISNDGTASQGLSFDGSNNANFSQNLTVSQGFSVTNGINSGGNIAAQAESEIRMEDNTGGEYVGLKAPATVTASYTMELPDAASPAAGRVLKSNASGDLIWATDDNTVFTPAASDYDANQIDNTPNGVNIAATNVQAAIDELDNEKVAKAGDTMTGDLVMGATSEVRFSDADDSHYVGFTAPAIVTAGTSFVWTLPVDDGSNGDVLMTNGSGALSWTTPAGGDVTGAANVGAGTGQIYRDETTGTINLKTIATGSTKLSVTNNANDVTLDVVEANIDHDALNNFVADEHINHSSVNIGTAAGTSGLSGGGDLTMTRNIAIDIAGTADEATADNADSILIRDNSDSGNLKEMTRANFLSGVLTSESDTLDTVVGRGASTATDITMTSEAEIRFGDSVGGEYAAVKAPNDLAANYTLTLPADDGAANEVLQTDGSGVLSWVAQPTVISDHGALAGLLDDDHTQYALLAGRTGGQNLIGGDASGDDLTLESTSHATKGDILLQPSGGEVGIGTNNPSYLLDMQYNSASVTTGMNLYNASTSASAAATLQFETNAGGYYLGMGTSAAGGDAMVWNEVNSNLLLATNNLERLRITGGGNVGIGTDNPATKFDVEGQVTVGPHGTGAGQTGQVILEDLAAGGTFSATIKSPDTLASSYTLTLPVDDGTANQVLQTDGSGVLSWTSAGSSDHGALSGLLDDDHTQYALLAGRAGGQSLNGGNAANDDLILDSTAHATKGDIILQPTSGNIGIGSSTPGAKVDIIHDPGVGTDGFNAGSSPALKISRGTGNFAGLMFGYWVDSSTETAGAIVPASASAGDIVFARNNTVENMRITNAGDVGIGTGSPSGKLDIEGGDVFIGTGTLTNASGSEDLSVTGNLEVDGILYGNGSGLTGVSASPSADSVDFTEMADSMTLDASTDISVTGTNELSITNTGTGDSFVVNDVASDTTPFIINNAGEVGIGTNSPSTELHVYSSASTGAFIEGGTISTVAAIGGGVTGQFQAQSTGVYLGALGANPIYFYTNGSQRMEIESGGDVGIGTTDPDTKLVVNGAITNQSSVEDNAGSIDFVNSNIMFTTRNCQTLDLHNIKDGGSYTLVIKGTTSATCAFNTFSDGGSTGLTEHLPSDHGATTVSTHTIYTFIRAGNDVYFSWVPGL